jgi:hypothetical protein
MKLSVSDDDTFLITLLPETMPLIDEEYAKNGSSVHVFNSSSKNRQ